MKYLDVVQCFEDAGYQVERIENEQGCIACIAAGARVIALAPQLSAENFLFNPEGILDTQSLKANLFCADGAPGGDRLWIAPENNYFRRMQTADYVDHSNHFVPAAIDPGPYTMHRVAQTVHFNAEIRVFDGKAQSDASMMVERSVCQIESPYTSHAVTSASYRLDQTLDVKTGCAGLWNIAQIPKGGVIVLPIQKPLQPTDYFNSSSSVVSENACAFYIKGDSQTKIGYGSELATGNSAAFYWSKNALTMVYREYPVVENGFYCDVPISGGSNDQVLQAWDGLGFGELEYHSIAAGNLAGVEKISDHSSLQCYSGSQAAVLEIASELLQLATKELTQILDGCG